ncbi:MAG: ABC transporter permease [Anaerolineales bacterium]|nr:ABC transporter permease [Anaerolineales bacterium]
MGTGKLSAGKLWMIAYRDLGRNRRRSLLTLIAVALGLALLVLTVGLIEGSISGTVENSIRLQTGHIQVRDESYDEDKLSLEWEDLLEDAAGLAAQVEAIPQVRAASPILWASGILTAGEDSVGVRVNGIDPLSETSAPFQEGIVAGDFLAGDDRSGILIGQRLADSFGLKVGDQVSLLVNTSDGQADEAMFTIRGLYDTGTPVHDETTVLMPISKAQAFARAEGRASVIFVLLHDQEQANATAAALLAPQFEVLTWRELNQLIMQAVETSKGVLYVMYMVVLAVVAVVIANTLLMSVFERTREMGILAALGMKGRQILAMFVLEAGTLGLIGILVGVLLGSAGVSYLAAYGWYIGETAETATAEMAYGDTIYARFAPDETLYLSIAAMAIILLASLYPAWLAARLEPIDALRAQ